MAHFSFCRKAFYEGLDVEINLHVFRHAGGEFTAKGCVKAEGATGLRSRWREDFWKWARDRDLDAVSPRYGNRRETGASMFDVYLKNWQVVADFIIMWVGIEALQEALRDRDEVETKIGRQLEMLTDHVTLLRESVERMERSALVQSEIFRAMGQVVNRNARALLVLPS